MKVIQLLKRIPRTTARFAALSSVLLIGWLLASASAGAAANEQPLTNADVMKMIENKIPESVILAKIQSSPAKFDTSTDAIIALNKVGVSDKVLAAMVSASAVATPAPVLPPSFAPAPSAPAPVPPPSFAPANVAPVPVTVTTVAPAPAPMPAPGGPVPPGPGAPPAMTAPPEAGPPGAEAQVSLEYFHAQLAPYGVWVEVPGYGQCWHPIKVIAATPGGDWRPYYDNGHWQYTENGWFWVSDYSWGDIPFHYGRWIRQPGYGWLWVPDLTWGPAWVCWRHAEAEGHIGWAPLPFGAVWVEGGWHYHGRAVVEVGFDFGLGEDFFVFVHQDHFHEHYFRVLSRREYAFHVHREVIHGFYGRSVLRNEFRRDEHGRFVNEGLGRHRIETMTHHEVKAEHFVERHPVGNHDRSETPHAGPAGGKPGPARAAAPEEHKVFRPPAPAPKPAPAPTPTPKAPSAPTPKAAPAAPAKAPGKK